MANYYVSGYTPPAGYTNSDSVRQLQQALNAQGANLKVDGIYGPKTHAAYSSGNATTGGGTVSYLPQQYKNYVSELQALLKPNTISYTPTSKEDYASMIQNALRPGYDLAIKKRQDATKTNKAEIDADAAARGMGASTWVTDVKDRQSQHEADDISTLESQYAAAYASQLMDALDREKQNQLAVDQFNASQLSDHQAKALGLADSFYSQYLTDQANAAKKSYSDLDAEPEEELTGNVRIGNISNDTYDGGAGKISGDWIYISGLGRLNPQQFQSAVASGQVVEHKNKDGSITYKKAGK